MPGEVIDRPNPGPAPSHLPEDVLSLAVQLEKSTIRRDRLDSLDGVKAFRQAANYMAAAMIFLQDNVFLERDLKFEDIKSRLLGHWGTCPGLTLVYAHLTYMVQKFDQDAILVVGPGHGAPGILGPLWLEGSLEHFYPRYRRDKEGFHQLISKFSTPAGFPSHISSEVPGSIHEGGELGYALSVAFGAVMDKPELLVTCIVGDGEAETGPTATAWNGIKYIDPKESGAVLPILHVNGFKISERTISGCMDNKELIALYSGLGYQVRIVEDVDNIDEDMAVTFEWAYNEIRKIQQAARNDKPIMKPRWPMIVLRTPKGLGAPAKVDGEFMEGSFRAHQVPLMKAKSDPGQLKQLQQWLESYKPKELFTLEGAPKELVISIVPINDRKKLGQVPETYDAHQDLKMAGWRKFCVKKGESASCMATVGQLLDQVLVDNPHSMRVFSPDELISNKLDAVFEHTGRNFQWDEFSNARGGRVIEMLSEHTLQGFLQGYTLTGRTGLFPSYESFLGIVHTMMVQYSKFNKMASETNWRRPLSSINYLETSTWTRQEHNGFSHQNPSFIGAVLNLKPTAARVYLPPDANTFLSTIDHCFKSKNYVNLMVGSKQPQPVFLSPEEAASHCRAGASVWKFASTDEGLNPDVTLVGIGAEITFEVISAAAILRQMVPDLRVRIVNVTDLMILENEGQHPHSLSHAEFDSLFTESQPIHFNYHGYANELKGLLFGRPKLDRVSIEAYNEEGSTTTPFDMMLRNHVSRWHVAEAAVKGGSIRNEKVRVNMTSLLGEFRHQVTKAQKYIMEYGADPSDTYDMPAFDGSGQKMHRDVGYAD
ncbi:MAG: hypothetical protein MMC23_007324 [Stictis urceolatum]|nr:hypothetical protein [Stictis urceolata]